MTQYAMDRIVSYAFLLLALSVIFLAVMVGLGRRERAECEKWHEYADTMPLWYATEEQKEQCDAVGLPLLP